MKKLAKLIQTEEYDIETDEIKNISKVFFKNKILIKKIENCKPFIGGSILFLCISIILIEIMIYLCLKFKNNVLLY